MVLEQSRRTFLRTASLAAAAGLTLTDEALHAATAVDDSGASAGKPVPFQVFTAASIAEASKVLQAVPGNKNLVDTKELPFSVVLTTETAKSAKEFEWHEGRDHILQVLEGDTVYELGGVPRNGRNTKPGEWLAPESVGSTKMVLKKGDMLVIPRGTPHKRSTAGSVTFTLISTTGSVKGS